ncbi:MAG: hemerythrin domain-containing protein [Syntrophobacteraceae bacterium]
MNPIQELMAEHEGIKVSLEILSRVAARMNEPIGEVDIKDIEHLIEFYKVFVDACHHGKEEELLFPALEAVGVSRAGGPIGVMLSEHDIGRAHVRELDRILRERSGGNGGFAAEFRKQSDEYIRLLLAHIDKENSVLFRIADENLPSKEKEVLAEGFERIENERIGIGKHEQFHKMLDELQRKYLN